MQGTVHLSSSNIGNRVKIVSTIIGTPVLLISCSFHKLIFFKFPQIWSEVCVMACVSKCPGVKATAWGQIGSGNGNRRVQSNYTALKASPKIELEQKASPRETEGKRANRIMHVLILLIWHTDIEIQTAREEEKET